MRFSHSVQRHALIQWLAFHGRLTTRDRLHNWGVVPCVECVLCKTGEESHKHLLFECPYGHILWTHLLRKWDSAREPIGFEEEINWAIPMARGKSFKSQLLISHNLLLYHIRGERNCRIFGVTGKTLQSLQLEVEKALNYVWYLGGIFLIQWRINNLGGSSLVPKH